MDADMNPKFFWLITAILLADRPHDSAQRAGESGSGDPMKVVIREWRAVGLILSTTLFAVCFSVDAQQPKKVPG
jgi:hypothetical protein